MTIKRLIGLFLLMLSISAISTLIFFNGTALSFTKWFVGISILQFGVQYCLVTTINAKYGVQARQIERESIKELLTAETLVTCPCHKKVTQIVPLRVNANNDYTCNTCKKEIAVILDHTVALKTTPINAGVVPETLISTASKTNES